MTKKIIYFVPVFLVIISIITSLIAFSYSKNLENGFIHVNDEPSYVTFEGEYFAIVGNLGDKSSFISVDSLNQHLLITIYDSDEIVTREYTLETKIENSTYSSNIVNDFIGTNLLDIDDIDEYIFTLDFEEGESYETILIKTSNNVDEDEIDLVLINLPEHLLNMKDLNEGISFSTLVFAGLSGFTILVIIFIRKDN